MVQPLCFIGGRLFARLLLTLLLALPGVAGAQFSYVTNNGTITITGYAGSSADIVIPTTINGRSVTAIGDGAFLGHGLTNLTIPESVTSIGQAAVGNCLSLITVTIGRGVKIIGNSSFQQCVNLRGVTIPDSVTNMGSATFLGCQSLRSAAFLNNGIIGDTAFGYCAALNSVMMGSNINGIGNSTFENWLLPECSGDFSLARIEI